VLDSFNISDRKILLVDDEKEILDLLETVLVKEGFRTIYKAQTGSEGIKLCREKEPDIIVLDIMLPDTDGFEVCRRLREFTLVPVLFLSAKSDDIDKLLGLGIGGDDYITKPFSPKEVAFRIKAQFRRNQYLGMEAKKSSDEVIRFGDIEIDEKKCEVSKSGNEVTLTAKEYVLLLYFAKNQNVILSKNRICSEVWDDDYIGYDNTIMVHIRHLREKIEDNPKSPMYIQTVWGIGYKFCAGESHEAEN
jgi:DNA-binding response OmpR family regulator